MAVGVMVVAAALAGAAHGRESLAELLAEPGVALSRRDSRERVAGRMREIESGRRQAAVREAARRGWTLRGAMPGGGLRELVDLRPDGRPVYFITHNANAAISTAAKPLWTSPYTLNGAGVTIGMWDGGAPRTTHQEFGGRVSVKDGAASMAHSTHVAGTMIAAGVVAAAHGMAGAGAIDAYEWTNDKSEMTSRAATYAGEPGTIYLSNHSYGYSSGWVYVGEADHTWEWYGDGTTSAAIDEAFGRYGTYARDSDALAHDAPYYLMFRSAGNDRTDNPSNGQNVKLNPGSSTIVAYDSAQHPPGDARYRGGYETISFDAVAKNVISVGSVNDAVTSGARDVSKAVVSSFSAWGPTDDGRIKPDVVANGYAVYSSLDGSDSSYGTYQGTSMSSPNAAGSAALLIEWYGGLFSGGAMRAATLKGLLVHTADDRGNPGPDYQYGWGLVNAQAAADLLQAFHDAPARRSLTEDRLDTSATTRSYEFRWDGVSPIKATLCWTDPEGAATSTSDSRTVRLVNDLDLQVLAPDDTVFQPFVMPFVGTWTEASMSAAATTGDNDTDNVEQVLISAPAQAGVYRAVVSFEGTLSGGQQDFSLVVSGSSDDGPPPSIASVSPDGGSVGEVSLTLGGSNFFAGADVRLVRAGQSDVVATGVQAHEETIDCTVDLDGMATGAWDVVVTNTNGRSATLTGGFSIVSALWNENFDGTVTGWSADADTGTTHWATTTAQSHSAPTSYFAPGPSTVNTDNLVSPEVAIPAEAGNLQLSFWHRYDLQNAYDGGVLEFSLDGGAWFDVEASGSGASFVSGGYTTTIASDLFSWSRNKLAGRRAWSGGSGGWVRAVVALDDTEAYAGKTLRMRWRLATNGSTESDGWYLDSIEISGTVPPPDFTDWQGEHFAQSEIDSGLADAEQDADGDGLPNLVEYALGEDPRQMNAGPAAELRADTQGDDRLALVFTRPPGLPDVAYTVEVNDHPGADGWQAAENLDVTFDEATNTETVVGWDTVPAEGSVLRRFIRLRVSIQ